ncbi:MAG: DUF5678 domain-containing protein [Blastocatellia bacterium]
MLDETVEKVLADIEQLSSEQQREVFQHLEKKVNGKRLPRPSVTSKAVQRTNELPQLTFTPRIIGEAPAPKDRSKEYEWLEQHRKEFAHQWVALDEDRLVSSNTNCRLVIDEARRQGVPDALIVYVEPPGAQSLIIW